MIIRTEQLTSPKGATGLVEADGGSFLVTYIFICHDITKMVKEWVSLAYRPSPSSVLFLSHQQLVTTSVAKDWNGVFTVYTFQQSRDNCTYPDRQARIIDTLSLVRSQTYSRRNGTPLPWHGSRPGTIR